MSKTTTAPEQKSNKRTYPYKLIHRKMLDLVTSQDQVDMLLRMARKEQIRKNAAEREFEEFMMQTFVEGLIEPANEQLDEQDKQDSMTLYASNGMIRLQIGRQRNRSFDDRSHQAKAYIQDFINDYESRIIDGDSDIIVLINMLKKLFFSSRQQKSFKFTPELQDFMQMDPKELKDERLKLAQKILQEAFRVEASAWYFRVHEFNEETGEYEDVE
jgi:hypothetical protein